MTRIVCISDTHNLHHKITIPEGDILIHAGDATMRGFPHEIESFLRWMDMLPHKTKIFVPGNHDFGFDKHRTNESNYLAVRGLMKQFPTVTVLRDAGVFIEGLNIYGTPWVQGLEQWAFGWKSTEGREAEFAAIPPDTDILITHGPSFGVMDACYAMHLGDDVLRARIQQLPNLKLHVHGHIHYSYGVSERQNPIIVNAAICTESCTPSNAPIVIDL